MANDLALMKAALPSDKTLVYGVLNQDSDQDKTTVTDPIYQASKDSRKAPPATFADESSGLPKYTSAWRRLLLIN